MYDIIIRNGLILDGTGSASYHADIAIKDGKIASISRCLNADAKKVIDASNRVVTPGFIDSHSHSDRQFFTIPEQTEKVEQGITTFIGGQCGGSIGCDDPAGVLCRAGQISSGANMALLLGHGSIRREVVGTENRKPTAEEMEKMKDVLRCGMENGAYGVSFGMIYAPGCFAQTPEMIELAKVASQYGGVAAIHLRDEGDRLIEAVEEFIQVVRASGVRGVISHHKAAGQNNWGKVRKTLELVDQANKEGMDIYFDVYPYIASHTTFSSAFIPKHMRSGGKPAVMQHLNNPESCREMEEYFYKTHTDMSYILLAACPGAREYENMRIPEVAAQMGVSEFEAALQIARLTEDSANGCFFTMCEEDVATVMSHPRTMIGTDSGVAGANKHYHPRLRGTFPRALGRYVRELGVVSLPEMIRKITSMPAAVYGLKTKGLIWEGFDADICIFDPEQITDQASFAACTLPALGLDWVIVGGKIAAQDAKATGELGGKALFSR